MSYTMVAGVEVVRSGQILQVVLVELAFYIKGCERAEASLTQRFLS